MSMYVLKDPDARIRFSQDCMSRLEDLTVEEITIYCLVLVKDNVLAAASSLIDKLQLVKGSSLNHSLANKVASLTAALWTSREYANSEISDEQRTLLRSLFGVCKVRHHFIDSVKKSLPKSELASYPRLKSRSGKAFLCMRKAYWSDGVKSREHEIGVKLSRAFKNVGWQTESISAQDLANLKRDRNVANNVVIFDAQQPPVPIDTLSTLARLKDSGFLVISLVIDFHLFQDDEVVNSFAAVSDVIWTGDICESPLNDLSAVTTDFPFPFGFSAQLASLQNQVLCETSNPQFVGGIERNNLSRVVYWVESSDSIAFNFSSHLHDGLDAEQSYADYLCRLLRSPILVNFALRESGIGVVTHKAFEAVAANRLLLQEDCAGIHRYLIENEHFFSFSGPEQLKNLTQDLMSEKELVAETANRAFSFYKMHYSDRALAEHIEALVRSLGR